MGNPGAKVSAGIGQIRFEGRNGNVKAGPGSQTGLGLRLLTRKRVLVPLISLMLLLVVLIFGIGWYFSGVLNYEGLVIREDEREFDLIATVVGEGQIRLEQGPDGGEWTWPGKWGIVWDGGNGMVGDITEEANDSIVRRFTLAAGDPPQSSPATLLSDVYPADPLLYLGIDYEEVQYDAPLGRQDAWRIEGDSGTWAVFVHGQRDGPEEGIPVLTVLHELAMPSLLITYRNDKGQPVDPSDRYQYGLTEWQDLHAAVEDALSQPGATDVVLIGNSMGGAIIIKFLYESPLAGKVKAIVLDSPVLDFSAPVDSGARERNLPGFITATAKWVTTLRFDVDWDALDYLKDVDRLSAPILLVHCTQDERIPIDTSDELAEQRPDLVKYSVYPECGHPDAWYVDSARYERELKEFLLSVSG